MSSKKKLTILITGCSEGGMGAALAMAFHKGGHHVYATARNPSKLSTLTAQGIRTITLDITSESSIASAVSSVSSSLPEGKGLEMLVNNAAGSYTMPIADVALDQARALFDQNVWGHIAVTQAFLPLLLKSTTGSSIGGHPIGEALIVNHTSVGSVTALPFQGVYNASKAALAMLSETMRLELAAFGIRVVDLKTAGVRTNIISNNNVNSKADTLPQHSIYQPAREVVEKAMSQQGLVEIGIPAGQWAEQVSGLLTRDIPPAVIWKGESALMSRMATLLPSRLLEGTLKKLTRLNEVEGLIEKSRA
ncbi:hypothetical protein H2204_003557 [Knufia peltigerae]|nr:hypothetical protein H2204_003557 [Knufia peltigerae]